VSEWICLWCDWTGGGDATACSQVRGPPPSACGAEDGPRGTDEPEQGRRGWPEPQAGLDGVEVEQEAPAQEETPRVTGVVVGRPEPPVGGTRDRSVEYIIKAAAICETANRRLLAVEETPSFPRDEGAAAVAVLRFSEKSFAKLRALPLPKGGRGRFLAYYSLLERQTLFLRRAATAASAGHTARARRFGWARPPDAPGRWARARATVVPGGSAGVRRATAPDRRRGGQASLRTVTACTTWRATSGIGRPTGSRVTTRSLWDRATEMTTRTTSCSRLIPVKERETTGNSG
jgi:hypothetical protein